MAQRATGFQKFMVSLLRGYSLVRERAFRHLPA